MPAKYAFILTTQRQAADGEKEKPNKQEQSHFNPVQRTFTTSRQALNNHGHMANRQPAEQT